MRKLKLQMQMSGDGFVGGLNGELDWMQWNWDDALKKYVTDLTNSIDTILLGRKLADGFIPYWADAVTKKEDPQFEFAYKMVDNPKIVFSKTLSESKWPNTTLAKNEDVIPELKQQQGKDMIVYGGANFVSTLINKDLIDELYLFVNPTALGEGLSIFKQRKKMNLIESVPFDCGIVLLKYEPAKN